MSLVLLVVAAVLVGALVRATFGFGEAVVSMPLLALLPIGLPTAAALVGLAGLTVALLSTVRGVRDVEVGSLARLSVGTVVGVPAGVALLVLVPEAVIGTVLGAFLVAYGAYSLSPAARPAHIGDRWAYPFGVAAGALGSAYNFNGVPVVVYATLRRWSPRVFRGTLQAHFVVSGMLVVAGQAAGGLWSLELAWLYAWCLPAIVLATGAGHVLHRRIPTHRFDSFVYGLVVLLGAVLLTRMLATG